MYKPCSFDRQEYLNNSEEFETISLPDVDSELSEQNEEPESLAYELAYTRYALAKIEAEVAENRIRILQYNSLRENFQKMITAVLGKNYYNMGMDVYECDKETCEDITRKSKGFLSWLFNNQRNNP